MCRTACKLTASKPTLSKFFKRKGKFRPIQFRPFLLHALSSLLPTKNFLSKNARLIGIKVLTAINKIQLDADLKLARFRWALERENRADEFRHVAWTDEVTIQNFGNQKLKVYTTGKSSDADNLNRRSGIVGKFKVNIWGFVSYSKSAIYQIHGSFNRENYLAILRDRGAIDSILDTNPRVTLFQQDNLRTHFVQEVTEYLDERGLEILEFPAYSPDLSPIENVWALFKRRVCKELRTRPIRSEEELWALCLECWEAIPQQTIRNILDSMPSRCHQIIKNCGDSLNN